MIIVVVSNHLFYDHLLDLLRCSTALTAAVLLAYVHGLILALAVVSSLVLPLERI